MANTNVVSSIISRRPRLRPLITRISIRYGGHRHKELERFIKFAFVGVIGTMVDLGISTLLMRFVFHVSRESTGPVLIASSIGFTIAVINNFIWNRYWTYPDSRSHPIGVQLGQFFAVNIVGLLIRAVIVGLLSLPFTSLIAALPENWLKILSISRDGEALLGGDMALIASVGVVMLWNFFVNRYWTYNDVK